MRTDGPAILWLRRDLRMQDNPALAAAASAAREEGVVPLYVLDPLLMRRAGAPRLAFIRRCLAELGERTGGALAVRVGRPAEVVPAVAREVEAAGVYVSADFGPYGRRRDLTVGAALAEVGAGLFAHGSPYAVDPGTLRSGAGAPYKVFSAFRRAWLQHGWDPPEPEVPVRWLVAPSDRLPLPPPSEASLPPAGEAAALAALDHFVVRHLAGYARDRDRPDLDRTSRLSPYLRHGCLHPRTVLARLADGPDAAAMRSELCWREFYADVLWAQPSSAHAPLQRSTAELRYDAGADADARFSAWCRGRTGFPLVDAGMRQLEGEAWLHNRVRMVVASFLVKDLHIDWRRGARHFLDNLVDGDLASNQHGWQWIAGTGTDPSPYVRVFNPVLQSERFDPDGAYIARWVPELAHLAPKERHEPWLAKADGRHTAGYPDPIVDHAEERLEALRRFEEARAGRP